MPPKLLPSAPRRTRIGPAFGESTSLGTNSSVRVSIQSLRGDTHRQGRCLTAFLVTDRAMAHPVLLSRGSRMRFKHRIHVALPLPDDHPNNGLLRALSENLHPAASGAKVVNLNPTISGDHFH